MKNICLILIYRVLLLEITSNLGAQVREPYNQLDLSSVSSQFFFPQTYQDWQIPTPYEYTNPFNGYQAAKVFYNFDNACLDPGYAIGDFGSLRQALVNQNAIDGSIPISILDITYHDFVSEALSANLIYFENGKLHPRTGQTEFPTFQ